MPVVVDVNYAAQRRREQESFMREQKSVPLRRARVIKPEGITFANDGIHVERASRGEAVFLAPAIFESFTRQGFVEEDKAMTSVPETKSEPAPAPKRKR